MFDVIPGAIAAIKESLSVFSTINEANRRAEVNAAIMDITSRLNDILKENTKLIETLNQKEKSVSLLEKLVAENDAKNADKEKWRLDSLNYEAWNPMAGTTLYRRKPDDGSVDDLTNFGPHCYASGKASALSVKSVETMPGIGPFIATLVCHSCNS
ncbi:hypothetical protein HX37_20970 [Salmonella enterica]|uniref:Uncharacterized protein n=1 Tax=Salmonella enterica TaxID=28901 RepID=A0A5U2FCA5_SALER|nr:hypothetical protein [Salmonella enterica]